MLAFIAVPALLLLLSSFSLSLCRLREAFVQLPVVIKGV